MDETPIKVGFTGPRTGMVVRQWRNLVHWLQTTSWLGMRIAEVHHGCCVGSDVEFVMAVLDTVFCKIVAHPSNIDALTDKWALNVSSIVHPPLPPLQRNPNIVDAGDVLLTTPKGPEELKSGTWATIRYARKTGKRIVTFWPDGRVDDTGA